jgi:flagellar export protein FliJ
LRNETHQQMVLKTVGLARLEPPYTRITMAKYKFRLETLQKVREARRNEQRASLAEAFRAEQVLAENRAQLIIEEQALRELQRSAAAGRYLDVNRLLEAQRYELLLKAQSQHLAKQAVLLAAETERRRQTLVEADREVRVLELLDERHRRVHDRSEQQMETKRLDEVATVRWRRDQAAAK